MKENVHFFFHTHNMNIGNKCLQYKSYGCQIFAKSL